MLVFFDLQEGGKGLQIAHQAIGSGIELVAFDSLAGTSR